MTHNKEEEINVVEIIKPLWKSRFFIIKASSLFFVLGIFISLVSPVLYTSSTTFIPQTTKNTGAGGLSGVASLVGIDIGGVGSSKLNKSEPIFFKA